jgi:hypothetical protein
MCANIVSPPKYLSIEKVNNQKLKLITKVKGKIKNFENLIYVKLF